VTRAAIRRVVWSLLAVLLMTATSGCSREKVCSSGKYPAISTEFPESGRVCVPNGQRPPTGYATYPPGQTPTYVDQDR
jgi:hypothetical protein